MIILHYVKQVQLDDPTWLFTEKLTIRLRQRFKLKFIIRKSHFWSKSLSFRDCLTNIYLFFAEGIITNLENFSWVWVYSRFDFDVNLAQQLCLLYWGLSVCRQALRGYMQLEFSKNKKSIYYFFVLFMYVYMRLFKNSIRYIFSELYMSVFVCQFQSVTKKAV